MVDKVDRPKTVQPWVVKETAASSDREGERRSQPEDEFSSPGNEDWQRLHSNPDTRRMIRVRREAIRHFWFRRAQLRRQLCLVEGDVELDTGEQHRYAQLVLPHTDDYFQLKGYMAGQEVPLVTMIHEPMVELSIPIGRVATTASTTPPAMDAAITTAPARWWQWRDPQTGLLRTGVVTVYVIVALLVLIGMVAIV